MYDISLAFSMSGAISANFFSCLVLVCDPTRPAPSLLLCDFKAPTEFSSSKKSNLLSGRFLEIRKLRGRPPPQKERQLGAGSSHGAVRRTFRKMSKLAAASQNVGVDMPWGNEGMTGDDEGGYLGSG